MDIPRTLVNVTAATQIKENMNLAFMLKGLNRSERPAWTGFLGCFDTPMRYLGVFQRIIVNANHSVM